MKIVQNSLNCKFLISTRQNMLSQFKSFASWKIEGAVVWHKILLEISLQEWSSKFSFRVTFDLIPFGAIIVVSVNLSLDKGDELTWTVNIFRYRFYINNINSKNRAHTILNVTWLIVLRQYYEFIKVVP